MQQLVKLTENLPTEFVVKNLMYFFFGLLPPVVVLKDKDVRCKTLNEYI